MQRKIIIMVGVLQFLTGCVAQAMGLMRDGENAVYGATNTAPQDVQDVQVNGVDGKPYFSQSGQGADTRKPGVKYVPSFGGNQYNSHSGHKVPEEVLITWREMPPPGGQPYTGERKGPYRVKVRERIPKTVLAAVRKDGITVDLSFGFDESSIRFDWKVIDYINAKYGTKEWCIGGDSFQKTTETVYKRPYGSTEPIPIWPHCKLPYDKRM